MIVMDAVEMEVLSTAFYRTTWLRNKQNENLSSQFAFSYNENLVSAIFLGIIGYLVCGIFYDSDITAAPMFWLLLGIGAATNQRFV